MPSIRALLASLLLAVACSNSFLPTTANSTPSPVAADQVRLSKGTDAAGNPQITLEIDPTEGFTMVIATFQRDLLLPPLLKHLTSTPPPSLRQILVVWQNVDSPLPEFLSPSALDVLSTSGVAVSVRKSWKNGMNERFRPILDWGQEILTDAVMIMDDDIVLRKESLEWGYEQFVEANRYGPGRIVGFTARDFEVGDSDDEWRYLTKPTSTYSMVLSNAAFLRKEWLSKYWDDSSEMLQLRNHVDSVFNCDDLLINYLVSNLTGNAPLLLQPSTPLRTIPTEGGLWNRVVQSTASSSASSQSPPPPDTITTSPPRPEHFSTRKTCLGHYFSHFARHAPVSSSPGHHHYPLVKTKTSVSQDVEDHSRWMFENEMWETVVWTRPVDAQGRDVDDEGGALSREEEEMLEKGDFDSFLEGLSDEEVEELMQSLDESAVPGGEDDEDDEAEEEEVVEVEGDGTAAAAVDSKLASHSRDEL